MPFDRTLAALSLALLCCTTTAQEGDLTSGRAIPPEQACYDVLHYTMEIRVDPQKQRFDGRVLTRARLLEETKEIVLDLDDRLEVTGVWLRPEVDGPHGARPLRARERRDPDRREHPARRGGGLPGAGGVRRFPTRRPARALGRRLRLDRDAERQAVDRDRQPDAGRRPLVAHEGPARRRARLDEHRRHRARALDLRQQRAARERRRRRGRLADLQLERHHAHQPLRRRAQHRALRGPSSASTRASPATPSR